MVVLEETVVFEEMVPVVSPVPTATNLGTKNLGLAGARVVSPMTLNLKGEEMPTHATTLEGAELVVSPVPTATTLGANPPAVAGPRVVSPITLSLKGEEMPTHTTTLEGVKMVASAVPTLATTLEGSDAAACPTTTNSLKPRNPTTNTGQDIPKTSTRPTKTNAAEMPEMIAETRAVTYPMLPPPHPLLRPSHRCVSHVSPAIL
ncbi:hypothetical protein F5888DRAFT_1743787 [Russula emetica]|nr:hypothetical protein F5888DRAFT_1743787 [Russula emetica]